jgi:uncharacterized protein (DUF433 family)
VRFLGHHPLHRAASPPETGQSEGIFTPLAVQESTRCRASFFSAGANSLPCPLGRELGQVLAFSVMSTATKQVTYPHVEQVGGGAPFISGTTMKVIELVMAQRAHGWSPEELSFQYPHLSMAQIYSALAYYWDHREGLDEDIERREQSVGLMRAAAQTPLAQRLAAAKHR